MLIWCCRCEGYRRSRRQDRPAAVQEARLQHCWVSGRLPAGLLAAEAGVYVRWRSSAPRSFFAGLAAAADVFGVTVGGILGHAMCTGGEQLARSRCGAVQRRARTLQGLARQARTAWGLDRHRNSRPTGVGAPAALVRLPAVALMLTVTTACLAHRRGGAGRQALGGAH